MLSTTSDHTKSLKFNTITTHPKHHYKLFSLNNNNNMMTNMCNNKKKEHDQDNNMYYHGGSSASIPFRWESQPGTPKVVNFRETSLPPLTPPPSYCYTPVTKRTSRPIDHSPKPSFMRAILFPKTKRFSPSLSPSSSSSSSSLASRSSSSLSPPSTPSELKGPSSRMSVGSRVNEKKRDEDEDDEDGHGSPVSTLCFGRISARYSSLIKVLIN